MITKLVVALALLSVVVVNVSAQGLNSCASCQFFVGTLISSLPENPSVSSIAAEADKLCDKLPSIFKNQCHKFVGKYKDQLIQFLSSGRSAENVCKQLRFCQATALGQIVAEASQTVAESSLVATNFFKTQDSKCDFCAFVMWQVQNSLCDNYTISNIANSLNRVCQSLPVGTQECLKFIESYFPLLVKYLSAHDTAMQVCSLLGLCNTTQTGALPLSHPSSMEARAIVMHYIAENPFYLKAQSSSGCQLCQWIVSAGEAWLSDGHNEAEISNFLQQVCDFFNQYAAQCQQLVAVYTPKVIEMLVENYTPPYICGQVGGCNP